jgi:hypothetical protein
MSPEPLDMELRDEHLEPLRRFLMGDLAILDRLNGDPDEPDFEAAQILTAAAVGIAVRRKFGASFYQREIIRFAADLRISFGAETKNLDPRVLEEVIRVALGMVHPNDIDHSVRDSDMTMKSHLLVLEKLRDENVIPSDGAAEFLRETMAFAQQMLETQRALAAGTLSL